ncbi:tetratricopeptide repeat protein [candidate division KSB1 bacterium]|nr:tetratricopeptide repeat protein [candidate division KSB1 bacterium]
MVNYGGNLDLFVLTKTGEISEYVLNENFTKRYFFQKGINTPVPISQTFSAHKDNSTFRIFCLGASTTQGFPYPSNGAYPAILKNILTTIHPDQKIEVLNCGITAIASHSVLDMEREILQKYQPDLIIVYSGQNEFYGVFGQASRFLLFKNRNLLQLFLKMQRSRLFLFMRNVLNDLFGKKIERDRSRQSKTLMGLMAKDIGIDFQSNLFQQTEAQYQENIQDMCRLTKTHNTKLMICNLVDNRMDFPPFASQHSNTFTGKDTTRWHTNIELANNFKAVGQYQEAANHYINALKIDSLYAQTHYQLGKSYYALQNYQSADDHFQMAKDYDVIRFRAPSSFNSILQKVALDNEVPFIDVEKAFIHKSPAGIVGHQFIHEHVHPNLKGYLLIAQTIAESMDQNSLITKNWNWTQTKSDSAYLALCHLTQLDHEVVSYTLFRLTSQWPFPQKDETINYKPIGNAKTVRLAKLLVDEGKKSLVELHLDYGNEFHQKNEFQQALDEYKAAFAIQPIVETYNRLGRLYLRHTEIAYRDQKDYESAFTSYQNGVFYFKEGLKRWPDDIGLNFNLGLLYFMRDDETDAAITQFLKVLELDPKHKIAYKQLIGLYIRRFENEKAKSYLQRAIALFPDETHFYTDMGVIYFMDNNLKESEKWLTKAINMNHDPKAKYFLNQVRAELKQSAE